MNLFWVLIFDIIAIFTTWELTAIRVGFELLWVEKHFTCLPRSSRLFGILFSSEFTTVCSLSLLRIEVDCLFRRWEGVAYWPSSPCSTVSFRVRKFCWEVFRFLLWVDPFLCCFAWVWLPIGYYFFKTSFFLEPLKYYKRNHMPLFYSEF